MFSGLLEKNFHPSLHNPWIQFGLLHIVHPSWSSVARSALSSLLRAVQYLGPGPHPPHLASMGIN